MLQLKFLVKEIQRYKVKDYNNCSNLEYANTFLVFEMIRTQYSYIFQLQTTKFKI